MHPCRHNPGSDKLDLVQIGVIDAGHLAWRKCATWQTAYPRGAWWEIDWFVRSRLIRHLGRRSQRPYRPPPGVGWYERYEHMLEPGAGALCYPVCSEVRWRQR